MTQTTAKKAQSPLKIAAGAVFLVSSVAWMIHRIPADRHVAAHVDAGRPRTVAAKPEAAPAAAPAAAEPVAAAVRHAASKTRVTELPPPAAEAAAAAAPAPIEPPDLENECRSEAAVLCYKIPVRGLPRCLGVYDDVLMRPCRVALKSFRSPVSSLDEADSGD
jgi:hypothetical protein